MLHNLLINHIYVLKLLFLLVTITVFTLNAYFCMKYFANYYFINPWNLLFLLVSIISLHNESILAIFPDITLTELSVCTFWNYFFFRQIKLCCLAIIVVKCQVILNGKFKVRALFTRNYDHSPLQKCMNT